MNSMSSVTVAEALAGQSGHLHLADDAFHLFSAPAEHLHNAESVTLTGGPALTFRQMAWLFALPNFSIGPQAHVRLSDTLGNTVAGVSAHADWLRQVDALEVQLAEGRIAAAPAAWLASLQTADLAVLFMPFARGGPAMAAAHAATAPGSTHTLNAAELLGSGLYAEAGRIIASYRGDLTVTDATVADLEILADLPLAGISITVADRAAAISAERLGEAIATTSNRPCAVNAGACTLPPKLAPTIPTRSGVIRRPFRGRSCRSRRRRA